MSFGASVPTLVFLSLLGCAPIRPPEAAAPGAAAGPAAEGARPKFEDAVLPILLQRCSPCHFAGGKMYERLPFDQPGTIQVLGTALFTRIRAEEERQSIRDFLGLPSEGPPGETDAP